MLGNSYIPTPTATTIQLKHESVLAVTRLKHSYSVIVELYSILWQTRPSFANVNPEKELRIAVLGGGAREQAVDGLGAMVMSER